MGETANAAKRILADLVAFDTTSHKSNLPLVRYVADTLASHRVTAELVTAPGGEKASLFATIGHQETPGVALSAHTDTVPAAPESWNGDPFVLTERNGRLHGRGTADMKGFIAAVLAAVPDFKRRRLKTPIHLVFSYDEEIGCLGVRPLIAELGRRFPRPRLVIVGEPTSMRVVDAHKGPARWQVEVRGRAAHSSMAPLGVNAITYAGRILAELDRLERELETGAADPRFDPPHATLQVTSIAGGTASNIVPSSCQFGFEVRALPGLDVVAIERRVRSFANTRLLSDMRRTAPDAAITVKLVNQVPPFAAAERSEAVSLALRLTGTNETFAVSYATEAGLFQAAGPPCVVCGPGDIAQAHTDNEWIAASEIEACAAFLAKLGDWAAANE